MDMSLSPVDELARLRASLAELRAREAALEAGFLTFSGTSDTVGRYHGLTCDVVVSRTGYQVFDISKLPSEILHDARYYATKQVTSIRIEEHGEDDPLATYDGPQAIPLLSQA